MKRTSNNGIAPLNKGEKAAAKFDELATSAVHRLSGAFYKLTESKERKRLREAGEIISHYVSWYLKQEYDCMSPINPMTELRNDSKLRDALFVKGISEEEWLQVSHDLLNVAPILGLKKDKYYENTQPYNEICYNARSSQKLRDALMYFNVSKEEWIQYGVKVLTLRDLYEENENREITVLNGRKL